MRIRDSICINQPYIVGAKSFKVSYKVIACSIIVIQIEITCFDTILLNVETYMDRRRIAGIHRIRSKVSKISLVRKRRRCSAVNDAGTLHPVMRRIVPVRVPRSILKTVIEQTGSRQRQHCTKYSLYKIPSVINECTQPRKFSCRYVAKRIRISSKLSQKYRFHRCDSCFHICFGQMIVNDVEVYIVVLTLESVITKGHVTFVQFSDQTSYQITACIIDDRQSVIRTLHRRIQIPWEIHSSLAIRRIHNIRIRTVRPVIVEKVVTLIDRTVSIGHKVFNCCKLQKLIHVNDLFCFRHPAGRCWYFRNIARMIERIPAEFKRICFVFACLQYFAVIFGYLIKESIIVPSRHMVLEILLINLLNITVQTFIHPGAAAGG